MAKRIILISSCPVCIVLVLVALIIAGVGRGKPADAPVDIEKMTKQAVSLIQEDRLAEAEAVTAEIMQLPDIPEKGQALQFVTAAYQQAKQSDKTIEICDYILQIWPKERFAVWTEMIKALAQLDKQDKAAAEETTERLINNYSNDPNAPWAISNLADGYSSQKMYGKAEELRCVVIDKYPGNFWAAGMKILVHIRRGEDKEALAAIDKMIKDFEGHTNLPEMVYRISREFEWTKGTVEERTGWYDSPNSVYEKLMQQFSNTSFGQDAYWDQKRLKHRMKIFELMKEADQNEVDVAIEQMVSELSSRPDLAGELYWIACGYEDYPNKMALARQMYERIMKEYPETVESEKAVLDLRRIDIWDSITAGDVNKTVVLLDKFVVDFNQHSYVGTCLGEFASKCYMTATNLQKQHKGNAEKQYFVGAESAWSRIIENNLPGIKDTAYYYAACSRQQLGRWEEAIKYYQKVADEYPGFKYACGARAAVGWCYEALVSLGKVPKEQAEPIIEQAYTAVLTNYPDCYTADYAALGLGEISFKKGDKAVAAGYYRLFLEKTHKGNGQIIAEVKAKLARIEGLTVEGGTVK